MLIINKLNSIPSIRLSFDIDLSLIFLGWKCHELAWSSLLYATFGIFSWTTIKLNMRFFWFVENDINSPHGCFWCLFTYILMEFILNFVSVCGTLLLYLHFIASGGHVYLFSINYLDDSCIPAWSRRGHHGGCRVEVSHSRTL